MRIVTNWYVMKYKRNHDAIQRITIIFVQTAMKLAQKYDGKNQKWAKTRHKTRQWRLDDELVDNELDDNMLVDDET